LGTYTVRDQSNVLVSPDLYLGAGQYNLRFSLGYANYPSVFFGTGEDLPRDAEGEDYTERSAVFTGTVVRTLYRSFRAGMRLDYSDSEIHDVQPGGLLDQGLFVGSEGGTDIGLGVALEWDDRNAVFWPSSGGYHQFNSVWHDPDMGGDFNYSQTTLDLRHFVDLGKERVLALRAYAVVTNGQAPFQKLAQLGGPNLMRGIYLGRFRDNHALVAQGEYRVILNNRWSITAFASVGEVAHKVNQFRLTDVVYTAGGGARYALDAKNRLNLRLDLGFSEYGASPIIVFQEAF
jgi:outer membrane protein assembly factor BamA